MSLDTKSWDEVRNPATYWLAILPPPMGPRAAAETVQWIEVTGESLPDRKAPRWFERLYGEREPGRLFILRLREGSEATPWAHLVSAAFDRGHHSPRWLDLVERLRPGG